MSKIVHGKGIFVCDLVTKIIACIGGLYIMYTNSLKRYNHPKFTMLNDLVCNVCDVLPHGLFGATNRCWVSTR